MEYDHDIEHHLEGEELCLNCLIPTAPAANFCNGCGAPIGFFATVLPYQKILAEGFLYREAIHSPKSMLTVIGIWLIFGTHIAIGSASSLALMDVVGKPKNIEDILHLLIISSPAIFLLVGLAGVYMVTKNYITHMKER